MSAQIYLKKWITRNFVRANPSWYFVFGDNAKFQGYGGQAKQMRGEPNAIGIPTKWAPTMDHKDFFYDEQIEGFWPLINLKLGLIKTFLSVGNIVVFPEDGIGTGLSRMNETAPRAFHILEDEIIKLEQMYGRKII